jgi:Bacterial antitoxin of type II TA system, VapB
MSKPKSAAKSGSVAVKRGTRSAISVDEKLAAKVKRMSKSKTTTEAVERALDFYARSNDYSKVLALYGTGGVAEGYDPKSAYSAK